MPAFTTGAILAALAGGAFMLPSWIRDFMQLHQQGKIGKGQLSLQEKMLASETQATKEANIENRKDADRYMAMISESTRRKERQSSEDRQLAMLMAMLQGLHQQQTSAANLQIAQRREAPPLALSTLLRGM